MSGRERTSQPGQTSGRDRVERFVRSGPTDPNVAPALLVAFGGALFLAAGVHHVLESSTLGELAGPLGAFLLDGLPAAGLAYAGVRLGRSDLSPDRRWTVFVWCVVGAGVLAAVMGASIVVRVAEERVVTEPTFLLLLSADAGGWAGFAAGYHHALAREAVADAERTADALAFVNGTLRHDVRNDIQVVETYADLIRGEADPDDETVRDHAEVIREQAEDAVAHLESTGAIAETLTGDPDCGRIDLADIAAESADHVADAYDATVTTDLPESAPVAANEGVRSVVDNLVENAAEHNDAPDPRIDVRVETNGDVVRLRVRDNGPGVPEGADVFGPSDGSVLEDGLHVVETLVEEYGGDVGFENEEPRGASFVVELPRAEPG